jgi:hypothetical protein
MTTQDFIIALFCAVDQEMLNLSKRPDAKLYPSEVVTLALVYALKGGGTRAFYRWLTRDYQALFPQVPERTRLFRLFKTHTAWSCVHCAASRNRSHHCWSCSAVGGARRNWSRAMWVVSCCGQAAALARVGSGPPAARRGRRSRRLGAQGASPMAATAPPSGCGRWCRARASAPGGATRSSNSRSNWRRSQPPGATPAARRASPCCPGRARGSAAGGVRSRSGDAPLPSLSPAWPDKHWCTGAALVAGPAGGRGDGPGSPPEAGAQPSAGASPQRPRAPPLHDESVASSSRQATGVSHRVSAPLQPDPGATSSPAGRAGGAQWQVAQSPHAPGATTCRASPRGACAEQ